MLCLLVQQLESSTSSQCEQAQGAGQMHGDTWEHARNADSQAQSQSH